VLVQVRQNPLVLLHVAQEALHGEQVVLTPPSE
jgi:hypothetical protein